jgi:uncharacterized protein
MKNNNRRDFIAKTLALGATSFLPFTSDAFSNSLDNSPLPQLKGRKILFTYGGWPGHEPEKFKDYFVSWLQQEGAEVLVYENTEVYTNKEIMDGIDLVIQQITMSTITQVQEKALLEAIEKNGTGFAGWHGGMCDSFRNNTQYQFMTGGQFVSHPGGNVNYQVNITNKKDAITKGLKNFSLTSEQYYMHIDPNVKVLATTTFTGEHNSWIEGCIVPITWKKMYGKGRVFYSSIGHLLSHIKDVPHAMEMIKRGIKWASASKYLPAEKWIDAAYD